MLCKSTAKQQRTPGLKNWKALLICELEQCFGVLPGWFSFSAGLVHYGRREVQRVCKAEGVPAGTGETERLADALKRSIRISETPQGPGSVTCRTYSAVIQYMATCDVSIGIVNRRSFSQCVRPAAKSPI